MEGLVRDCDKLAKHQTVLNNKALHSIDSLLKSLEEVRRTESDIDKEKQLLGLKAQVDKTQSLVNEQLKDLYTTISKYGKHVEKAFKLDLSVVSDSTAFADKKSVLAETILQHFLRSGDFAMASSFAQEARLALPAETQMQFEDMYRTVSELRNHELSGAINWAVSNRAQLEGCEINLEFGLHELRFLQLIEQGQTSDALKYAREWFPRFAGTQESLGAAAVTGGNSGSSKDSVHLGEIQHLMGIFIYAKDLAQSPYADKFDPQRWEEGARGFASAFCTLLGLASESPLGVAVGAGARALPVVCKMSGLMRSRHVEWSAQDELAVEVALPDSMRFHSVFACPVSKEQATSANPPMMMPCGHVVCKLSLDRLARGVRPGAVASGRFKCPYCPSMSTLSDAKRVFF